jgi:transcriptional regulator GlxA family with amidase domain
MHPWRVARKPTIAGFTPRRVAVLAYDGVVLADLAGPCELLRRARARDGRALYRVEICSEHRAVASSGVALDVPHRLARLAVADTIIVPGVEDLDAPVAPAVHRALVRARARGARLASICTGAFVLAATGAFAGARATTHWIACAELARRHPSVHVDPDVLFVDNGDVLSSAGAAAGLDLCLHLVRRDFGAEAAAMAARLSVMPLARSGGQAQFIAHAPPAPEGTSMAELVAWLEANLQRDLDLAAIARRAAMSPRTLSRRFPEEVGTTPAQWLIAARVREAQRLLETSDASLARVAAKVGFRSTSVLREHFVRAVGVTPHAYRRNFT